MEDGVADLPVTEEEEDTPQQQPPQQEEISRHQELDLQAPHVLRDAFPHLKSARQSKSQSKLDDWVAVHEAHTSQRRLHEFELEAQEDTISRLEEDIRVTKVQIDVMENSIRDHERAGLPVSRTTREIIGDCQTRLLLMEEDLAAAMQKADTLRLVLEMFEMGAKIGDVPLVHLLEPSAQSHNFAEIPKAHPSSFPRSQTPAPAMEAIERPPLPPSVSSGAQKQQSAEEEQWEDPRGFENNDDALLLELDEF